MKLSKNEQQKSYQILKISYIPKRKLEDKQTLEY